MEGLPFEYDVDALIQAIIDGQISTANLPQGLYLKIADHLKKGLYEGFGAEPNEFTMYAPDMELLKELRKNIYMFSGAKTYQQVRQMSAVLGMGMDVIKFSEAKEAAKKIFKTFNVNYLRTEYDTAIGQATSAKRWNKFEQDAKYIDLLVYDAVIDANTSDICRPLDGIKLPVNHPFWNTHAPLNHFNCRCLLRVATYGEKQSSDKRVAKAAEKINPEMQDVFKMNPGKDKYVFSEKHPYFQVAPKDRGRKKDNFGLPIPEKD